MTRLTFIEEAGRNRHGQRLGLYQCECGERVVRLKSVVKMETIRSCGCLQRELVAKRSTKHGMRHSPEYGIWQNMKSRCGNANLEHFKNYGGRGLSVCARWLVFENFVADMGLRPSPTHTLERVKNDIGYEPGNVIWATAIVQANNTRRNHFVEFAGERLTISQWARRLKIDPSLLHARLTRLGWSVEKALGSPVRPLGPGSVGPRRQGA